MLLFLAATVEWCIFLLSGYQGSEEDSDKLLFTEKLLDAVLAEDFNADPGIIPCSAKGISAGRFVDLALAYSLGAGKGPGAL